MAIVARCRAQLHQQLQQRVLAAWWTVAAEARLEARLDTFLEAYEAWGSQQPQRS